MAVASASTPPLGVAVDLVPLRPGGENGGIKPFLFELLGWLGRQEARALRFIFLTNSLTHADVRDELARLEDTLICVRHEPGGILPAGYEEFPRERVNLTPPSDLVVRLGGTVLYCPFGPVDFACPGLPTVATVVDVLHRDFPPSLPPDERLRREGFFRRMAARAERLQCNTDYVKGRMTQFYDVEPERMFHVYNAIHTRFDTDVDLATTTPAALTPSPVNAASPYFLYPANTWLHKNHEVLLLAFRIYRQATTASGDVPWDLVLTGHADRRLEELKRLTESLDLGGAVRFPGYLSRGEFGRLWREAGALVFPSLHEGFGIPLLEAMHHGVPILCSTAGSLPEVGADACLYVEGRSPRELAAAMTRLAGDAALRAALIRRGRRRLEDFSMDQEGARLLAAFTSLADGMVPSRPDPTAPGLFADGWTGPMARFPLPAAGRDRRCVLRVVTCPMPAPRRLTLRCGAAVVADLRLPVGAPGVVMESVCVPTAPTLELSVPDAARAPGPDDRHLGVRLAEVRLRPLDDASPGGEKGWDLLGAALSALATPPEVVTVP